MLGSQVFTASYGGDGVNFAASSTVIGLNSVINTVAGNGTEGSSGDTGPATAAEIKFPYGVATDAAGDIFIADTGNNRIREVNHTTGNITTVAGNGTAGYSGDNGPATAAELNLPEGVRWTPPGTSSLPTPTTTASARSITPPASSPPSPVTPPAAITALRPGDRR